MQKVIWERVCNSLMAVIVNKYNYWCDDTPSESIPRLTFRDDINDISFRFSSMFSGIPRPLITR